MKKIFTFAISLLAIANANAQFYSTIAKPDTLIVTHKSGQKQYFLSSEVDKVDFSDSNIVVVKMYNGKDVAYSRRTVDELRFRNRYSNPYTLLKEKHFGAYESLYYATYYYSSSFYTLSCLASDEMLGGGDNYTPWLHYDYLSNPLHMDLSNYRNVVHSSICHINDLLVKTDQLPDAYDKGVINHTKGEMLFLRAYNYYELASLFDNIHVITDNQSWEQRIKVATPEETWGQIMLDLKNAIELMDGKLCPSFREDGRVSRYAAEAMLARAFLFYTGFYQGKHDIAAQDASVNLPDGSTLSKQDVIDYLTDCVKNSPFRLVNDFRTLWPYTNRYTVEHNPETANKGLKWVEDDGAINPEVLFKIRYNTDANWNDTFGSGYANMYAVMFGHLNVANVDYEKTFPIGGGWGAGSVAPNLYEDWEKAEPGDMRRSASIQDMDKTEISLIDHSKNAAQLTQYHEKKISPVIGVLDNGWRKEYDIFELGMFYEDGMPNTYNSFQHGSIHPLNLIRFADVLLMHSELTGTTDGINKVRARAGLNPISSYSLEALQQERRWELAFEGVRWNDMRRWGDDYCKKALDRQLNQPIINQKNNVTNTGELFGLTNYSEQYAKTHGFFKSDEERECEQAYRSLSGIWTYGDLNGVTYGTVKYDGVSADAFINNREGLITGYTLDEMKKQVKAAEGEVNEFARMSILGDKIYKITANGDTIARGTITLKETNNYDWRICTATVTDDAMLGGNGCSKYDIIKLGGRIVMVDATSGKKNGAAQFWVFRRSVGYDYIMYSSAGKKWSYSVSKERDENSNGMLSYDYVSVGSWGYGGKENPTYNSFPVGLSSMIESMMPQQLKSYATEYGITDTRDADPYAYMQFDLQEKTVSKYTRDGKLISTGAFECEYSGNEGVKLTVHNNATLFPYSYYTGKPVDKFIMYCSDGFQNVTGTTDLLALREDNGKEQFTYWNFAPVGLTQEALTDELVIRQFDNNDNPADEGCNFTVSFKDGQKRTVVCEATDGTELYGSIFSNQWSIAVKRGTTVQKEICIKVINCNGDTVSLTRNMTFTSIKPTEQVVIYDDSEGAHSETWSLSAFRFSDNEGQNFPYISDSQFEEMIGKELHVVISDATEGATMRVCNGWLTAYYTEELPVAKGDDWHFVVTKDMFDDCSRYGTGMDLVLLVTNGEVTISKIYYEK